MRASVAALVLLGACTPLQSSTLRADAGSDGGCATGALNDDANCGRCGVRCAAGDTCRDGTCVPTVGAPRPVAPLAGSTVRAPRPTLRWSLATGSDGARVELCHDRAMTVGCVTFDALGSNGAPPADLAPRVWFWRASSRAGEVTHPALSPTWQLRVGSVDSARGSTLDTDGDGRVELAIGAPRAVGFSGRVYLYEGFPDGRAVPLLVRRGAGTGQFGSSLASAGDVNGDNFFDLLVGTLTAERVSLYLGSQQGIGSTATVIGGDDALERFGVGVAGVGDVNGDGFDDVAVTARSVDESPGVARVYLGSRAGVAAEPAVTLTTQGATSTDVTVSAAGDVNGDGFADVALGVGGASGNAGAVHVFFGGAAGVAEAPAVTRVGTDIGGQFGHRVSAAGDVDGDGYADLFVSAPFARREFGRVFVFHGSAAGLEAVARTTIEGDNESARMGIAIAPAADLDGDGFSDLVVSASGQPANQGSATVFRGGANGIARQPWQRPRLGVDGADSGYGFLLAAGDFTHDGRGDLVVTSVGASSNSGRAYLYPGVPGGLDETPVPIAGPDGVQAVFGWGLACAGRRRGAGRW